MPLVKLFELMIVVCYKKRSPQQCYERRGNRRKKRKRRRKRRKRKRKRRKRSQRNIIARTVTPTAAMSVIQEEIEEMIQGVRIDNEIVVTQIKEGLLEMKEIWRDPEMEELMIRQEMIAKEDLIVLMIAKRVDIPTALALEKDLVEVEVALEIEEREEQKDRVLEIERPRDECNSESRIVIIVMKIKVLESLISVVGSLLEPQHKQLQHLTTRNLFLSSEYELCFVWKMPKWNSVEPNNKKSTPLEFHLPIGSLTSELTPVASEPMINTVGLVKSMW